MSEHDHQNHPPSAAELAQWQDWLAELDEEALGALGLTGEGIALSEYGYSPCPKHLRDTERRPLCEPPSSDLSYVICRYVLEGREWPWAYLRFWTRFLQIGGRLVLFTHDRHWEWADRYACWELPHLLENLGFAPPFERCRPEHGFGYLLAAAKGEPTSPGTVLHAGAVEKGGRAALIHGLHGSGKTSLLLRLLREGWRFLADSFTLVDAQLAAVRGVPFFSVRPGAERIVPELSDVLARHPAGDDATGRYSERDYVNPADWKHRFRAIEFPGLELGRPSTVSAVLFTQVIPEQPTSVQTLSSEEAEGRLEANRFHHYAHNLSCERAAWRAIVDRLLAQAKLVQVTLGEGDPVRALGKAGVLEPAGDR